tara:strand:+ start:11405 stop:11626 length:222 start_codon:yes stop_codon:yes gene_type:complete
MAYAYVVRGSEDGNIGVFGSRGRAEKVAVDYVSMAVDGATEVHHVRVTKSKFVTYVESDLTRVMAEVEKHYLG